MTDKRMKPRFTPPRRLTAFLAAVTMVLAACTSDTGNVTTTANVGASTSLGGSASDSLIAPIRFVTTTAAFEEALFESNQIMIDNWRSLGLEVEIEAFPQIREAMDRALGRGYDAMSMGYGAVINRLNPSELLSGPFLCEHLGEGGSNYSDWCHDEYDEVVRLQSETIDLAERRELVWRAQELIALDVPWVTHYHQDEIYAYNHEQYESVAPVVVDGLSGWQNFQQTIPIVDDGIIRIGSDTEPRSMNPMTAENFSPHTDLQRLVFDTLAMLDAEGRVVPHLAIEWEFDDPQTVTVHLRDDVQFQDGEPLTADDVKFSYDFFKEWDIGAYVTALSTVDSVEVEDSTTVRFNLTAPNPAFPFQTLATIMVLPQHQWDGLVDREGLGHPAEHPDSDLVGSGLFSIAATAQGEAVELVRNEDFWGSPAAAEGVIAIFFGDSQGVFRALQDGSIGMTMKGSLAPDAIEQINAGAVPHLTVGTIGSISTRGTAFNMAEGSPFRDYPFRLAMAHTVDGEFAVDVGNRGYAVLGRGIIAPANSEWHNTDIPRGTEAEGTAYWAELNLERAREILTDAGYTWDKDGRLHYPEPYTPQLHFDE